MIKAPIVYMRKLASTISQDELWDAYDLYKAQKNKITRVKGPGLRSIIKAHPYKATAVGVAALGTVGALIYAGKKSGDDYKKLWENK